MTPEQATAIKRDIEQAIEQIKLKHGLVTRPFTFTEWEHSKGYSRSHMVDENKDLQVQVDIKVARW